jgi:hypothetical protein
MMFGHDFYHGTLRKYVIMFGNLFDEITVDRRDTSGNLVQTIHLPITYGPKQKWLARVEADPDLNRPLSITLPRLGFTLDSMTYAPSRKLNSARRITKGTNIGGENFKSVYAPVPYDMQFTLYALVKNAEDGVQIIEQIVPFFTPDFTVTMHALSEMDIRLDVPIELTGISSDDSYEGDFESRRVLTWQMNFTVKGYLFGPVNKDAYINKATITLNDDSYGRNNAKQVWKGVYEGNSEFGFTETIIETSE